MFSLIAEAFIFACIMMTISQYQKTIYIHLLQVLIFQPFKKNQERKEQEILSDCIGTNSAVE
jgi:hypothetical protein